MPEKIVCRVCGRFTIQQAVGRVINGSYPLLKCLECSTILTGECRVESEKLYDGLYDQEGLQAYEQHRLEFEKIIKGGKPHRPYQEHLLAKVERMCDGRRMIEIGGGVGIFGKIAVSRGWDYTNHDVSDVALSYAGKLGLKTRLIENQQINLAPNSADLIALWEVIEHIREVSGYLKIIREALAPNGVLLMSTPNYFRAAYQKSDSWGVGAAPPVHVNFFTRDSLAAALRFNGFSKNHVFVRRIYPPTGKSPAEVLRPLRFLLRLEEPPTLYSISRRS
ncbi:MAG: class I SAM-dependent methyltransferase [Blastocatellales bacterium]